MRFGNINLTPAISHNIYVDYQYFNYKNATNYLIYLSGGADDDAIIYSRFIDPSGIQYIVPANADGIWRAGASISFGKLLKKRNNRQVSLRATLNPNYYNSVIMVNGIKSSFRNISLAPSVSVSYNHKDIFEINEKYIYGFSKSKYSNPYFTGQSIGQHTLQSELIIRLPKHFVWETAIENIHNPSLQVNGQRVITRWNAALNYLFLKDEKAQLRVHVFDILNKNSLINRVIKENYLSESRINTLTRYFMVTFSYNIRNFRTRKVGGKNSLLFY